MLEAMTRETPTIDSLPPGQRRVVEAIRAFWAAECRPPSFRDLCTALGIRSPNGILCHVRALAAKGAIELAEKPGDKLTARGIWLPGMKAAIRAALAAAEPTTDVGADARG